MVTPSKTPKLSLLTPGQRAEAQLKKKVEFNVVLLGDDAKNSLYEQQVQQDVMQIQSEKLQHLQIIRRLDHGYNEVFEYAPIAYFAFDHNGIINRVNLLGVSLLAIEKDALVGQLFSSYVMEQHKSIFNSCLAKAFEYGSAQSCEIVVQTDRCKFWLRVEANLDATGMNCLTAMIDITNRKRAEDSRILVNEVNLKKKKQANKLALAASVFAHAGEAIIITDPDGIIIDVNDRFIETTGYSYEEIIGENADILQSGIETPEFYLHILQALIKTGSWNGEIWSRRKNGEIYSQMKTISAIRDGHNVITHYVTLGTDITHLKEHQNRLERMAHYDILTQLPNRSLLADRLSQAMLQCNRQDQLIAVLFLDLDGFKQVNDLHGHDVGDRLLIIISQRIKDVLREGDTLARIGGDEFVAILTNLEKVEDCDPILERFLLAASEPITIDDVILKISVSIGVTLYPQNSVKADQLLRHADQAMYVAKQSGKNCYHLFDPAQDDVVKVQRKNLKAIRRALDERQFVLHYQPKVNMRTGALIGVEALIRWQHPKRGLLDSIDFVSIIEKNPMSIEMDEWVIDTALAQISQWQKMGLNIPVSINVNITAIQLQQPDFTDRLALLLAAYPDVEPHYLELEILETSTLDDGQQVSTIMNACAALGVSFGLDDFGKGYSSLTYLRQSPVRQLKIDQSFVSGMLVEPGDLAIVEGVIALAKSFKIEVIAEGVETIEHGSALLQLGCELAQGYGIAKPMLAEYIPVWMNDWKPDVSWQS